MPVMVAVGDLSGGCILVCSVLALAPDDLVVRLQEERLLVALGLLATDKISS